MEMKRAWDELHKLEQFRPRYPNDRIVAWIFRNFARAPGRVVDILDLGSGAGRHAIFFAREGYRASACDFSAVGVAETQRRAEEAKLSVSTAVCEADDLAFPDDSFDGVVVFGTFAYLPYERFVKAVAEMHRVLKPGGKAMIMTPTGNDARVQHGEKIGHCTYRILAMGEGAPSGGEIGMVMTFPGEAEVGTIFGGFSKILVDRLTTTKSGGIYVEDDWYIHVEK